MLAVVLICACVGTMTAISIAKASQSINHNLISSAISAQAQAYATSEAELIKATDYANLSNIARIAIAASDYQKEVSLSDESDYSDSIKQKTVTIKIYKEKESLPRATISFNRYSEDTPSGVPIGTVIAWPSIKNPTDGTWLECNGQSCSSFPILVELLGSSTVPDYRDRFLEGSATPGTVLEAGLPNITGYIWAGWMNGTGVFKAWKYVGASGTGNGWTSSDSCSFDASRSSAIYGNSDTVQPPAVTVRWLIKAA